MFLYQQQQSALGSACEITFVTEQSAIIVDSWFEQLWTEINNFEQRFSRFLKTSELFYVNSTAGGKTRISKEMYKILSAAKQLALQTEGIFNPFILPCLEKTGYVNSWLEPEKHVKQIARQKVLVPITALELWDDWVCIPNNAALDLGGCGKGHLLDQIINKVKLWTDNFWISLGGDIVVAGTDETNTPWQIGVAAAQQPEKDFIKITPPNKSPYAIATSGITKRRGKQAAKFWHHIIDPRIEESAKTDILTATVCSTSALQADVLAKCAVILGSSAAKKFIKQNNITEYYLQTGQI